MKHFFILIAVVFSLAAASRAEDKPLDKQNLFPEYPEAQVKFYPIKGKYISDLCRAINKIGPKDRYNNKRYALTEWHIKWSWPTVDGLPDLAHTTTTMNIVVTLPDWQPPKGTPKETKEKWARFFNAIILHEKGHLEIAYEGFVNLQQAFARAAIKTPDLTKEKANQLGYKFLSKIRSSDQEYDIATDHGRKDKAELACKTK